MAEGSEPLPGLLRWNLGDVTVTVLNDGWFDGSLDLATGLSQDEAGALQAAGFRAQTPRITVNAFLVTGKGRKPLLIDSGYGAFRPGDTVGRLQSALAAAGIAPAEIETVLVSHLHPDHIGGLLTDSEVSAFPNAELVIHETEAAHWLPDDALSRAPEGAKPYFENARNAVAAYGKRMRTHSGGDVAPGIEAIALPGHTPGHCGFRIASGPQALLMWTDIVHLPAIQFKRPDAGVVFDADGAQAQATRKRIFEEAASDRMLIAGSHLEFPALGYVARDGAGYSFVPELWVAAS